MTGEDTPPPNVSRPLRAAQQFNAEFGTIMRLVGLLGSIGFGADGKLAVAGFFFGFIPASLAIGKGVPPS